MITGGMEGVFYQDETYHHSRDGNPVTPDETASKTQSWLEVVENSRE